MARALLALALLAGCDVVFITEHDFKPPDGAPDAAPICVSDPFDSLATNWNPVPNMGPMAHIETGKLVIPYGGRTEAQFNRLVDFTTSTARVELLATAPVTTTFAVAYFAAGVDLQNHHAFAVYSDGTNFVLEARAVKMGTQTQSMARYDAVMHRYLRMRHNPTTNVIEMQTNATLDPTQWKTQSSPEPVVDVRQFQFYLGTLGGTALESASFDNFELCK